MINGIQSNIVQPQRQRLQSPNFQKTNKTPKVGFGMPKWPNKDLLIDSPLLRSKDVSNVKRWLKGSERRKTDTTVTIVREPFEGIIDDKEYIIMDVDVQDTSSREDTSLLGRFKNFFEVGVERQTIRFRQRFDDDDLDEKILNPIRTLRKFESEL